MCCLTVNTTAVSFKRANYFRMVEKRRKQHFSVLQVRYQKTIHLLELMSVSWGPRLAGVLGVFVSA